RHREFYPDRRFSLFSRRMGRWKGCFGRSCQRLTRRKDDRAVCFCSTTNNHLGGHSSTSCGGARNSQPSLPKACSSECGSFICDRPLSGDTPKRRSPPRFESYSTGSSILTSMHRSKVSFPVLVRNQMRLGDSSLCSSGHELRKCSALQTASPFVVRPQRIF